MRAASAGPGQTGGAIRPDRRPTVSECVPWVSGAPG